MRRTSALFRNASAWPKPQRSSQGPTTPSFPLRFGVTFGGAALFAEGYFYLFSSFPDEDLCSKGRAFDTIERFGVIVSTISVSYLSAQKVLTNHCSPTFPSAVVDSLVARPSDAVAILKRAGGHVGLRAAFYFAVVKTASLTLAVGVESRNLQATLLLAPAAVAALFVGIPFVLPLAGVAYLGGRTVGASLGRSTLVRQSSSAFLGSVVQEGLFSNGLDALYASRPLLCRAALATTAVLCMLPRTQRDLFVIGAFGRGQGGGGGGGSGSVHEWNGERGYSWRYENRWSIDDGTALDGGRQQDREGKEHSRSRNRPGERDGPGAHDGGSSDGSFEV